jgi:hypothetical protein
MILHKYIENDYEINAQIQPVCPISTIRVFSKHFKSDDLYDHIYYENRVKNAIDDWASIFGHFVLKHQYNGI